MGNDLTNPLAGIVALARKKLPVEGEVTKQREHGSPPGVLLVDVSSSMAGSAGAETKIVLLRRALDALADDIAGMKIVAFGSFPTDIAPGAAIPEPAGGTALHLALYRARSLNPAHLMVISDGQPDDSVAALSAARQLLVPISTLYIGRDDDFAAKDFMRRLASATGGEYHGHDIAALQGGRPLVSAIKRLALPPAKPS